MTTSLLVLKQDVLNLLAPRNDSVLARLRSPLTTTSLAGNTTSIVDTVLGRGTVAADAYQGCYVEIAEAGGPALGSVAAVDQSGFAEPGTLTVSPAFSTAVISGTDYNLYPPGLSPELVRDQINTVLRMTEGPHIWIPSIITDYDLEANDSTKWPAVGTPATRSFSAAAADVLLGERSLWIIANLNEGAQSLAAPVTQGEVLTVSVHVKVVTQGCKVQLYNDTASSVIREVTVNEKQFTEVRFTEAVPVGCENIRLRFLGTAGTSEFLVSAYITVQPYRRSYSASWLTRENMIQEAIALYDGWASKADRSLISLTSRQVVSWRIQPQRSDRGVVPFYVQLADSPYPILLRVYRAFSELSSLASVTPCDREYVRWKAAARILHDRHDDTWLSYDYEARAMAAALGYGLKETRIIENRMVAV